MKTYLILLVEDSPDDELFTRKALTRMRMTTSVLVAKDGGEAIELLRGNVPDLVLLDLKMPRVDGIEVLRQIRTQPLLHQVPVIVLSSSDEPRDVRACYENGANSYVRKPVDYEAYVDIVFQIGDYWLNTNHRTDVDYEL